ncbi:MAG TPA: CapA family protein [Burkholderiaceae bacterium]|nr:CapA family protein [Burkholderiaceae bacterium]
MVTVAGVSAARQQASAARRTTADAGRVGTRRGALMRIEKVRRMKHGLQRAILVAGLALGAAAGCPPALAAGHPPGHILVLIGGDTYFGESYQEEYARKGGTNILLEKSYDYGLANLSALLKAVDFRILNLETPLTPLRNSSLNGKHYVHYGDPAKTLEVLDRFGPIAYSLANNHTLDQGAAGLDDTRAAIATAGARCFGAGRNLTEAQKPLIQRFQLGDRQLTLAVFGGLEYTRKYDDEFTFYATADRSGTARLDASSVSAVRQAIDALRRKEPEVFTIYFMHSMANYSWKTPVQAANAQMLRQAGVDLVVGAGAHMMQEIEHDGGQWILFGIGNFVFDAAGRYGAENAPAFSLPLVIDFFVAHDHLQQSLRVYPIVSDNTLTRYRPRFVTDAELGVVDSLLAQRGNWDPATRAAVKTGKDTIGNYIELFGLKPKDPVAP